MSERFCIGGSNVDIGSCIDTMQQPVRNRAQLNHILLESQLANQRGRGIRTILPGIRAGSELTRKKESDWARAQLPLNQRQRPDQRLKVAVVIVMADEKQS